MGRRDRFDRSNLRDARVRSPVGRATEFCPADLDFAVHWTNVRWLPGNRSSKASLVSRWTQFCAHLVASRRGGAILYRAMNSDQKQCLLACASTKRNRLIRKQCFRTKHRKANHLLVRAARGRPCRSKTFLSRGAGLKITVLVTLKCEVHPVGQAFWHAGLTTPEVN